MRMRKKKNLDTRLENCSAVIVGEPEAQRGRWRELFGNDHPLFLEIGCGKGRFILESARRNPDINYLAIEREEGALIMATERAMKMELPNLRFLDVDAARLTEFFADGEIDRIYLNFSDPWPKDRHAKRRLTSKEFFARYNVILKADGRVEFKTDNRPLFDFSVESVKEAGWKLDAVTYDLHHDEELCQGNVMTEYEEKFSSKGNPIHKLIAVR